MKRYRIISHFDPSAIFPQNDFELLIEKLSLKKQKQYFSLFSSAVGIVLAVILLFFLFYNPVSIQITGTAAFPMKQIKAGELISTGDGTVQFQVGSDKVFLLAEHSEFLVQDNSHFVLYSGKLYGRFCAPHKTDFFINAGKVHIQILGTKFSIAKKDENVEVYVDYGHIRISQNGITEELFQKDYVKCTDAGLSAPHKKNYADLQQITLPYYKKITPDILHKENVKLQNQKKQSPNQHYINKIKINRKSIVENRKIQQKNSLKTWGSGSKIRNISIKNHIISFEFCITNETYGELGVWLPDKFNGKNLEIQTSSASGKYFALVADKGINGKWLSRKLKPADSSGWLKIPVLEEPANWENFSETFKKKWKNSDKISRIGVMVIGSGDGIWYGVKVRGN